MKRKEKRYEYIKYGRIICRYEYFEEYKGSASLGEIYDTKTHTWVISRCTISRKMDGEGSSITKSEAFKYLKIA